MVAFEEVATNEYGYTRVFRAPAYGEKYVIVYLDQFNGDKYPRTDETWKVETKNLEAVLALPPGPIPYNSGGKNRRKSKAGHSKDTNAKEFSALLAHGEKLSDEWSPVFKVGGNHYLIERQCNGHWQYGAIYKCNALISLVVHRLSYDVEPVRYCQFTKTQKK